jgi:hypothetical protein
MLLALMREAPRRRRRRRGRRRGGAGAHPVGNGADHG